MDFAKIEPDQLLIFLHIPKTAGMTVDKFLSDRFSPQARYYLESNGAEDIAALKNYFVNGSSVTKYITGHLFFGIHQLIPRKFAYVTFLREPVERIISLYYFILSNPKHRLHEKFINEKISLLQFVKGDFVPGVENHQTRQITGVDYLESFINNRRITEKELKIAIQNLETHFSLIGITELFDDSLFFLSKMVGGENVRYTPQNINPNRPRLIEVDPEIQAIIRSRNEFDILLYQHVKKKFQENLNRLSPGLKNEVKCFKKKQLSGDLP